MAHQGLIRFRPMALTAAALLLAAGLAQAGGHGAPRRGSYYSGGSSGPSYSSGSYYFGGYAPRATSVGVYPTRSSSVSRSTSRPTQSARGYSNSASYWGGYAPQYQAARPYAPTRSYPVYYVTYGR
jgi:hypothetical protein